MSGCTFIIHGMHAFQQQQNHIFSYDFIMKKAFPSSCLSFVPEIHFCVSQAGESLLTALLSSHSPDSGCFLTLNPSEQEALETVTSDALCSSLGLTQGRPRHRRVPWVHKAMLGNSWLWFVLYMFFALMGALVQLEPVELRDWIEEMLHTAISECFLSQKVKMANVFWIIFHAT